MIQPDKIKASDPRCAACWREVPLGVGTECSFVGCNYSGLVGRENMAVSEDTTDIETYRIRVQPADYRLIANGSRRHLLCHSDRGVQVGDEVVLIEYRKGRMEFENPIKARDTGNEIRYVVKDVQMSEFLIPSGHCILSLGEVD